MISARDRRCMGWFCWERRRCLNSSISGLQYVHSGVGGVNISVELVEPLLDNCEQILGYTEPCDHVIKPCYKSGGFTRRKWLSVICLSVCLIVCSLVYRLTRSGRGRRRTAVTVPIYVSSLWRTLPMTFIASGGGLLVASMTRHTCLTFNRQIKTAEQRTVI